MMLISRLKPIEEIVSNLGGVRSLLLLACNGCEESFGNSEPGRLKDLRTEIEKKGPKVTDLLTVDFLCEELLVKHWLPQAGFRGDFEGILVVSCGIGVQVVSAEARRPTFPACDTVTLGGRFGQSWGKETCKECGECLLTHTGGICPLTACSKGLLNGPCGGSQDGRCEVFPQNRECGWQRIYQRLEAAGRKDLLSAPPLIKDFSRSEPPEELIALQNQLWEKRNETL